MTAIRTSIAALGTLAAILLLAWPGGARASVGFLAVAEGEVEIRAAGRTAWAAAAVDGELETGDAVRTGRGGLAKLVLADDTVITLDEETELVIDHYVLGPLASGEPSRIELLAGHVRTKLGETFGDSTRLRMLTPTAAIGVKGTEWLTWYREAITWVCVVSGVVETAARGAAAAASLDLGAGECARVGRDEAPERGTPPPDLEPVEVPRASSPPAAPAFFPAHWDDEETGDRQVISPNDNVGRDLDVPEPESPRAPLPEPEPPTRTEPKPPGDIGFDEQG